MSGLQAKDLQLEASGLKGFRLQFGERSMLRGSKGLCFAISWQPHYWLSFQDRAPLSFKPEGGVGFRVESMVAERIFNIGVVTRTQAAKLLELAMLHATTRTLLSTFCLHEARIPRQKPVDPNRLPPPTPNRPPDAKVLQRFTMPVQSPKS